MSKKGVWVTTTHSQVVPVGNEVVIHTVGPTRIAGEFTWTVSHVKKQVDHRTKRGFRAVVKDKNGTVKATGTFHQGITRGVFEEAVREVEGLLERCAIAQQVQPVVV